ncbi:DUF7507 domain-containing protein [Chelativorans xinjiangense]|uniref:DUF7507 domain-containing protein n=1 Tax=Chelativorans xinjiangense TaxID=2681485 RepID=UPI001357F8F6|nr:DUF11 domain-containing protein [Chelativorans xinjiangense]
MQVGVSGNAQSFDIPNESWGFHSYSFTATAETEELIVRAWGEGEDYCLTNFAFGLSALKTVKTASTGATNAGDTVTFTIEVENTGVEQLTNIGVDDNLLEREDGTPLQLTSGPTWVSNSGSSPQGTLQRQEKATFTATYVLTQEDVDAGLIRNQATAVGTHSTAGEFFAPSRPGPVDPEGPTEVPIPPNPAIDVLKQGTLSDDGTTITYTFTVSNIGNVTVSGITVTDPLFTVQGGPITLAPDATDSTTFTGTYTVTANDLAAGQVENVATAAGTDPSGAPVTAQSHDEGQTPGTPTVTELKKNAAVDLTKTGAFNDENGNGFAEPGETIGYTFTVRNTGDVALTNVTVTDPKVSVTGGPLATLAAGATDSTTFTATYTLTADDLAAGQVENTATVTGTDPGGAPVTAQSHDEGQTPGTPTVTEVEQGTSGLDLTKTGAFNDENGNGFAEAGETIGYTFTVRNMGDVDLTNVTITDPKVSVTGGPLATLAAGATDSTTFTATYTVTADDLAAGQVENVATATGTDPSGEPVTAQSHDEGQTPGTPTVTEVEQGASTFDLTKTGTLNDANGNGYAEPGETIGYTFTVRNTGDVDLTNVTVTDPKVSVTGGPLATLAAGATDSTTFTATYTLTAEDLANSTYENTATATGTDPGGAPVTAQSHDEGQTPGTPTVTDTPLGDGDFIKTSVGVADHNGDGVVGNAGDRIDYAFTIVNMGNVAIETFTISDPGAVIEGTLAAPIPVGGRDDTSFTGYHVIAQEEIDAGVFKNLATGTATTPGGGTFTKESRTEQGVEGDETETPLEATPQIKTELVCTPKDTNGSGIIDAGDKVLCEVIVTNTGNVTLTDVTVDGVQAPAVPGATTPVAEVAGGPIPVLKPGESNKTSFTVEYALTQEDLDAGGVLLQVEGTGTPPVKADGSTAEPVTDLSDDPVNTADKDLNGDGTPDDPSHVALPEAVKLKVTEKQTIMPDSFARAGDVIEYRVTIDNVGNITAKDVKPNDPGPTFGGKRGTSALSAFTLEDGGPVPVAELKPADAPVTFIATYVLSAEDVKNALLQSGETENTASAEGASARSGKPIDDVEPATSLAELPSFGLDKASRLAEVRRGETVPYALTLKPRSLEKGSEEPITVIDTTPPGFAYLKGTAAIGGRSVEPEIRGRDLVFVNVPYTADMEEIVISYRLGVSGAASPGKYVNRARVVLADGTAVSAIASAEVEVVTEPVFDCGDLIGRVFDDLNRNGYQDVGEPGLGGVRVATVDGLLVTTDAHGRFHVACADMPKDRIGSTFIMKLDPRTLPTGYRLISENPRTVRLTAGKASRLNFAATVNRVIRLDLNDAAFEPETLELRPEWQVRLPQIIALLEPEVSVLRLAYVDARADRKLVANRMRHIRRAIGGMWKERPRRYRLEIETRIETRE